MTNLPYKGGRYDGRLPVPMQEAYEHHVSMSQPLDVYPEIASARAFMEQLYRDHEDNLQDLREYRQNLRTWHEDYDAWQGLDPETRDAPPEPPEPVVLNVDPSNIMKALKTITDAVHRERALDEKDAIPVTTWLSLAIEMWNIVGEHMDPRDPESERRMISIARGWTKACADKKVRPPDPSEMKQG